MKLSYKWLSQYVDLAGISPEELADRMTTAGLEVEGIEKMADAAGLKIGEVIACEDIPDTHLHNTITRVGDKPEDEYHIVCGAPNCRKGLKVIAALPGAKLPGGTIEAKPLHGYESNGMLCALYELGVSKKLLNEKQLSGIEELPADAPVGESDVLGYLGLDDTILDVSLTPNRADCSAMWNMAWEVGAILNRKVTLPETADASKTGKPSDFRVASETDKCTAYLGKVVNHVKVGPSPKWMVQYLQAAGMNSINNVVDISNFVMLETGQPLHYYDLNKLKAHEITVVSGRTQTITALDGAEFAIEPDDVLITTNGEATGIAGIMGGEESMIDENTTAIFIEAAHFHAATIRKTSIRLNLVTEAAQRFTKGIDPLAMYKAMDRSVDLLTRYADASDLEENVFCGSDGYQEKVITETLEHCNGLLGTSYTMDQLTDVCERLGFQPEVNGTAVTCHIPSWRIDMEGQADVDEEVIRLIGYDDLPSTLPWMEPTVGRLSKTQRARRLLRDVMVGFGLHEIMTYTLVSDAWKDDTFNAAGEAIPLAMPMSEARRNIRTGLMNSVLEAVQYNEAHGSLNNNFFEISKVYAQGREEERVAVVLDGMLVEDKLHKNTRPSDFYTMKGILTTWLERCGIAAARIRLVENNEDTEHFHPYRSAIIMLDGKKLGTFGEVHPTYAGKFDLKRCIYAEVSLDLVLACKTGRLRFNALDRYPGVARDIALVVDRDTSAADILKVVTRNSRHIVHSAEIFDVYEGEHVAAGKKSVALHIVYMSPDHTLKEEEIAPVHENILKQFKEKLNAELRA
jgi:phenylalanyl-tRNA synthetase beta chain